jgi:plasmid stabilization system protein ParE
MTFQLVVEPAAHADADEAYKYYESKQHGLGAQFMARVEEVFDQIRDNPQLFATSYRMVRQTLVRRFPFVVSYLIDGDRVVVIAICHGRRNPRTWKSRLPKPS